MTAGQVPASSPPDQAQQLDEEIAATRARLGEAVEQLVALLDVKSQARARANRIGRRLSGQVGRVRNQAAASGNAARQRPAQLAAAGGVLIVVAALVVVRLRSNGRRAAS